MSAGLFGILGNISALMDDTATIVTKTTVKVAGVLGDDVAVNAEKSSKFAASREIPVLKKIIKGSFKNKFIILPIVFILNAIAPYLIVPILIIGGIYLSYEGAEKVLEMIGIECEEDCEINKKIINDLKDIEKDPIIIEAKKIKEAITTDFVLSIEIVLVALGSVVGQPLLIQVAIVTIVAILATIGVYGLVAIIIRMDDFGFSLKEKGFNKLGEILIKSMNPIIKLLTYIGTIAMLAVAGGIFEHSIESIHHLQELVPQIPSIVMKIVFALIIGIIIIFLGKGLKRIRSFF